MGKIRDSGAGSNCVKTMITLGDMADKGMTMLEAACQMDDCSRA
jgi:hypothetical protein